MKQFSQNFCFIFNESLKSTLGISHRNYSSEFLNFIFSLSTVSYISQELGHIQPQIKVITIEK
jgi:hypothetical protein